MCILVEFDDVGSGCCDTPLSNTLYTLTRVGTTCQWHYAQASFCGAYNLDITATLSGTTLTVVAVLTDGSDTITFTFSGTVETDCRLWHLEGLTLVSAVGDLFCGDPVPETGSAKASYVSCDCPYCVELPNQIIIRLAALATQGGSSGACCEAVAGDWVLPYTADCTWTDAFEFCADLTLEITASLAQETATTAKLTVTMQIKDGATVCIESVYEHEFTYPTNCSNWEIDLGSFASYTENCPGTIDCFDPVAGTGCNVVDPTGVPPNPCDCWPPGYNGCP